MSKRTFLCAILVSLTACNQLGNKETDTIALSPTFGTPEYDDATGLAPGIPSGVYIVGQTRGSLHWNNIGGADGYIRKYDSNGRLLWGRQFGTSRDDSVAEVAVDRSDNTYTVGHTLGSLAGSLGGVDAFIRKYSASGSVLWTRQFGTSADDYANYVMTSSSGVYVVGQTRGSLGGPNQGSFDAFARKYNPDGTVAWTKQFGTPAQDLASAVAVDNRGYAYVVGNFGYRVFIRQYGPSGNVPWAMTVASGDDFSDRYDAGGVAVTGENVYVGVLHCCREFDGVSDAIRTVKYTTRGSRLWGQDFALVGGSLRDMSADGSGVVLNGTEGPDYVSGYVSKLSPSGTKLWTSYINLSSQFITTGDAVVIGRSGEIYAAGGVAGDTGIDAYLQRLNSSTGATIWTK